MQVSRYARWPAARGPRPSGQAPFAGIRSFIPTDLAGLSFLFRPEAGISLATGVAQWSPVIGSFSLGQGSGGAQPSYGNVASLAGKSALGYDGGDVLANATTYNWALGFYIAAVILPTNFSITRAAVGSNSGSGAGSMFAAVTTGGNGNASLFDSAGTQRSCSTANSMTANAAALVEARYYGTTLGSRLNNGTEATLSVASPPSTARGLSAGSDGAARVWLGSIALIAICQGVSADPANRREFLRWAKDYYGITGLTL